MSRVDIWVLGFEPGWSESPSEGLNRVFGLETQEALTLELTVPTPVKRVESSEAKRWLQALRSIGAEVEQRPAESGVPPAFDLREPVGVEPAAEAIEGVSENTSGVTVFEGPPGLVMPTKSKAAKAKAKAEVAALAGALKKAPKRPPSSGVVKEEVMRVIRTPSMPQDRRPPPARIATEPAVLEAEPGDEFGELDLTLEPSAPPPSSASSSSSKAAKSPPRSSGAKKSPEPAAEPELELEDVRPRRAPESVASPREEKPVVVEGPSRTRGLLIGVGLVALGLVGMYVGVMRFESSLLGTGSVVTWLLDAAGFGALIYGLVFSAGVAAGRDPDFVPAHLGAAVVLGFGLAYGIALLRGPNEAAVATLAEGDGDQVDARELIAEPRSRLAGASPEQARAIIDAAYEGGAVDVNAAHVQSFLGRRVAHLLVIEMPASGGARAHMAALIRRALGAERATLASNLPSGDVWVLPLRL